MNSTPYLNQVYKDIKSECLSSKRLFIDEKFPPCDRSIKLKGNKNIAKTKWKRAKDLSDDPKFIANRISREDLEQGELGDCWFVSAIAAIADHPQYRQIVIPDDQSFGSDYCGLFHFRFWQKGQWVDVVVDDYLPIDNDDDLINLSNGKHENSYWCPLLEKAYAKLFSCYELIEAGMVEDSLTDLSGGVAERFDLIKLIKKQKTSETKIRNTKVIWKMINRSFRMGSVCATGIWSKEDDASRNLEIDGLVDGHAYTVTGMDEKLNLIQIRNPHGHDGDEWKGAWSDGSKEWKNCDEETRKRLSFVKKKDGEFWMNFNDYIYKFDRLSFLHININAFIDQESSNANSCWNLKQIFGEWKYKPDQTDNLKFWSNPQHVITLNDSDKQIIIALMITDYIEKRKQQEPYPTVNYHFFKVKDNNSELKRRYKPNELERIGKSDTFEGEREATKRFNVKGGIYVIIPVSRKSTDNSKKLLRAGSANSFRFNMDETGEEIDFRSKYLLRLYVQTSLEQNGYEIEDLEDDNEEEDETEEEYTESDEA